MTDYREISALGQAPERARSLAQFLLKLVDAEWSDWELDFLEGMSEAREALSTRQAEKLVELRDACTWYETVDGFSLRALIEACFVYRDELTEQDQEFIGALKAASHGKLRRRQASRLLRCARNVGAIEPYQGRLPDAAAIERAA